MTCHIAISGSDGAVLVSDSQASTNTSEIHNVQKVFCGNDFVVAGSGAMILIHGLFYELESRGSSVDAGNVAQTIETYVTNEVVQAIRGGVDLIVLTHDASGYVQEFHPGAFVRCSRRTMFSTIGSGAEFVRRAMVQEERIGIARHRGTIADTLIAAAGYMDAANESLTVDDTLWLSFLRADSAYIMAYKGANVRFAHPAVAADWNAVTDKCTEIMTVVQVIRSEIRNAQRQFSKIAVNGVGPYENASIANSDASIRMNRMLLTGMLQDYFDWYDALIGRAAPIVPGPTSPATPAPGV